MIHIAKWKIFIAISVCIIAIFTVISSFSSHKKINLGLDLRGGAYLLLEVDYKAYFTDKIQILRNEIRGKLKSSQTNYMNLLIDNEVIKFSLEDDQIDIYILFAGIINDITIKKSNTNVTIGYSTEFIKGQKQKLLAQSLEIIRRRIDEMGTKEVLIQPQGDNRIMLQVPGVKNPERVKEILGKTAKLSFHLFHPSKSVADSVFNIDEGYIILESEEEPEQKSYHLVKKQAELTGESLNDAQATIIQGKPQINFRFDNVGARKFAEITRNNIGKRLSIILDNKIISSPIIREPILAGQGVISGNYTIKSANDLALLLRAGSLPAPLNIIEERTVGPTLGADSIIAGKNAVLTGFILILLIMLIIYRLFGIFAIAALTMNIILIFASLSLLGATLTLPGIAGIVLTIGMSVDTNVLIFERIREESKTDKSIYAVIDQGFTQALKTIMDSNITTLLVALILFNFGSGPIKGFAITLILGILSSVFSAIFLTKMFIYYWAVKSKPNKINI
jgi:preprotein translocase subunit SecD